MRITKTQSFKRVSKKGFFESSYISSVKHENKVMKKHAKSHDFSTW